MTTFDKREDGFEKKFAHDEELKFKASARRNKLVGLWAAEKLGMSGAGRRCLCQGSRRAPTSTDQAATGVFKKIRTDFDAKGVTQSDHQIRRTMDEMMEKAIAQIKATG